MNQYRTHTCGAITIKDINLNVVISGWLNKKRDHGGLLFLDIRDNYGITQCVIDSEHENFKEFENIKLESVLTISGIVIKRSNDTINTKIFTGEVEIKVNNLKLLNASEIIPFQISSEDDAPEELRLKHRYLDLRKKKLHQNILLRSKIINSLREKMKLRGFFEIQTPILTSSSPEGARDFLVPSRLNKGKFYALPQAPQMFKQLLMVAGFDKYFQIAPCFRDEDARSDRSPGEFYQLDFEMSFVNQDDIFNTIEPVLFEIFEEYSNKSLITKPPFRRIKYDDAIKIYGTDKPDLRNPLIIQDVTDNFIESGFKIFEQNIRDGSSVKAIKVPNSGLKPRSWFDKLNNWAREQGKKGLGYITFENNEAKGPIANNLNKESLNSIKDVLNTEDNDSVFFICDKHKNACYFSGIVREKLCDEVDIRKKNSFEFCWIVDYPMYEYNEITKKIEFSHNPFSMPQGGMNSLVNKDPLDVLAWQFDIVCNGVELSSGAIRNHKIDIMKKAFEIAGYNETELKKQFGGIYEAFQYGAPPHGGSAPGIDRIIMLLASEKNLREVVAFPLNQQAEDLMLGAPNHVESEHLKELNIEILKGENEETQ